jgi:hypothetical protein
MGVGRQDENRKRKPKPLSNRNLFNGATWNHGPSAWDSYFITNAYDSYEVYNTVSNISNVRLDLCAWHGSDHLGYSNIYAIWVSTTFRVHFEGNHLSRGRCTSEWCAAAVHTQYMLSCISDINPSKYFSKYCVPEVQSVWATYVLQKNASLRYLMRVTVMTGVAPNYAWWEYA